MKMLVLSLILVSAIAQAKTIAYTPNQGEGRNELTDVSCPESVLQALGWQRGYLARAWGNFDTFYGCYRQDYNNDETYSVTWLIGGSWSERTYLKQYLIRLK